MGCSTLVKRLNLKCPLLPEPVIISSSQPDNVSGGILGMKIKNLIGEYKEIDEDFVVVQEREKLSYFKSAELAAIRKDFQVHQTLEELIAQNRK